MPLSALKGPEAADVLSERAVGVRHAAEAALHPSPEPRLIAAASPALQAFERQRRMNRSALQAGWYREAISLRPCVTMLWTERCYQQISALHSKDFASAEATKGHQKPTKWAVALWKPSVANSRWYLLMYSAFVPAQYRGGGFSFSQKHRKPCFSSVAAEGPGRSESPGRPPQRAKPPCCTIKNCEKAVFVPISIKRKGEKPS